MFSILNLLSNSSYLPNDSNMRHFRAQLIPISDAPPQSIDNFPSMTLFRGSLCRGNVAKYKFHQILSITNSKSIVSLESYPCPMCGKVQGAQIHANGLKSNPCSRRFFRNSALSENSSIFWGVREQMLARMNV